MTMRSRGLLPITGPELELARAVGLEDIDLRDLHDLFLSAHRMPARAMFFFVCRAMVRRGLKRVSPLKPARPASKGNGPSRDAVERLEAAIDGLVSGSVPPAVQARRPP